MDASPHHRQPGEVVGKMCENGSSRRPPWGPRRVRLTFEFDADGDIISFFMADRPRQVGKTSVPTP